MKIDSSNVSLYSESTFQFSQKRITSSQIHYKQDNAQGQPENNGSEAVSMDILFSQSIFTESSRVFYDVEENMSHEDRIKKIIIEKLLEAFYGEHKKTELYPHKKGNIPQVSISNPYTSANNSGQQEIGAIVYNTTHEYYQKQTVDFSASVEINTPGKSFSLDLDISYSKSLYESHSSSFVIGDERFIDPLVINYDTDINPFENLSSLKFEFDLDQDGEKDLIPMLKQGSGYLAFDKNGNGIIDDGSELFGTKSNDGFKDLGKYDSDNNNWIDENDEVFNKLKIWQINDNGQNKLVSLLDMNVGAIYLGDVQSGYKYQSSIENTQAVQKSNGIFIKEDGSGAGMVNSIDIAV
jgi:hypothetical protein